MIETTSLAQFQRILVRADGTVTALLEAWADEAVEAVKMSQELAPAGADAEVVAVPPTGRLLRRRVVLRGGDSGRIFLCAEALIVPERVDPWILDQLVATTTPVGTLLARRRTETFRELLGMERQAAGPCGGHLEVDPVSEVLVRTYRVFNRGRPIMGVTEKFPVGHFR